MNFIEKLFGRKKKRPNIDKLKKSRDIEGLINALEYGGDNADEFGLQTMAAAVKALGELGGAQAIAALNKLPTSLDRVEMLIRDLSARLEQPSSTFKKALGDIQNIRQEVANTLRSLHDTKDDNSSNDQISKTLDILNEAYLVRRNAELEEAIKTALDSILSKGEDAVPILLNRLFDGVSITRGRVDLKNWGDMAWNEFLKKREIIRCLERGRAISAKKRLQELLDADCSDRQWSEIIIPALRSAINTISVKPG